MEVVTAATPMPKFVPVCPADDIPEGEVRMQPVGELVLAIFHIAGEYYALDNQCPHAGASLAHGYIDGDIVSCRIHHWRFCIRDGKYVDEDKPHFDAHSYPVRLADGMIEVDLS